MQYQHPFEAIEFEVPNEWLAIAGAQSFKPQSSAFLASSVPEWPTVLVPIAEVEAPRRDAGIISLHENRAVSVLRAIVEARPLPPIEVYKKPFALSGHLTVRDGYHRYFLSIALGFTQLPVSVRPYFDFNAL